MRLSIQCRRHKAPSLVLSLSLALSSFPSLAEITQNLKIDADSIQIEDKRKVTRFLGSVTMRRGQVTMRGDSLELTQQPGTPLTAGLVGKPASIRQTRPGSLQRLEGHAATVFYDDGTKVVTLTGNARLTRFSGEQVLDSLNGDKITLDTASENYSVETLPNAPRASGVFVSKDGGR